MYNMTLEMLLTTVSMRCWKLARHPSRPIGLVTHWNCPMPMTVKAVYGLALGCKIICLKSTVRSIVLKIEQPEWPILPFADAFTYIFHGVLICLRFLVDDSEVLDKVHTAVLLHDSKDGAVSQLYDSDLEPFKHVSFYLFSVGIWNFKLPEINWFL
jgi:hypothetical protein